MLYKLQRIFMAMFLIGSQLTKAVIAVRYTISFSHLLILRVKMHY